MKNKKTSTDSLKMSEPSKKKVLIISFRKEAKEMSMQFFLKGLKDWLR